MSTRRTHTKSRFGCRQCKQRKVKCDERHPACFNCTRYRIVCSFVSDGSSTTHDNLSTCHACLRPFEPTGLTTPTSETLSLPQRPSSSQIPESPGSGKKRSLPSDGSTDFLDLVPKYPRIASPVSSAISDDSWTDIDLMHHYCVLACDTMGYRDSVRHVWREVFPREGRLYGFVMHGLLAVAALHKASLLRAGEQHLYLTRSAYHYDKGQETFRSLLSSVTEENWKAMFCFSAVVDTRACTPAMCPGNSSKPNTSISDVVNLLSIMRGVRAILEGWTVRIRESDLAAMTHGIPMIGALEANTRPSLEGSRLPRDTFDALSHLRSLYHSQQHPIPNCADYDTMISSLERSCIGLANVGLQVEVSTCLLWTYSIPESVIDDLRRTEAHALVLLSYMNMFIAVLDKDYWFFRGWSSQLLADINSHLKDDHRFDEWLAWPRGNT
ncbi:hypothetical protein CKAH01_18803 [Colletotrichum kahawae]|uniref:Zn(2)-C6 fungal-type domain-containing protein n=1 Tax=Colletotrichum kahawae TaxID=34407 RepID=A0AAE0D1V6_COLKA|nr:hypothetical protein CKAH01_18803 [Colletotrichum kahawae]